MQKDIDETLNYLLFYEEYTPYQIAINEICNYISELEEKYHMAVITLQAISQHTGRDKETNSLNEWTQAEAFLCCRYAAERTLKGIGESTKLH